MKKFCAILGKELLIVLACIVAGFVALLLVFSIPTERIEKNVSASAPIFQEEGTYPRINVIGISSQLDNFTDALMLLHASYVEDETSILDRVINVYSPKIEEKDPTEILVSFYTDKDSGGVLFGYLRTILAWISDDS